MNKLRVEERTDFVTQPPSSIQIDGQSSPCERTTIISRIVLADYETREAFLTSDDFNKVTVHGFGCLLQSMKHPVQYPVEDQYICALTHMARLILPPGARFQIVSELSLGCSGYIAWKYDRAWHDEKTWDAISTPIVDMATGVNILARLIA